MKTTEQTETALINAAENMDWQQVVLNGGTPCFYLQSDGCFCGRARRWDGHDDLHRFCSLADLLRAAIAKATR